MLFMYYPFRDEKELLSDKPPTHESKRLDPGVIDLLTDATDEIPEDIVLSQSQIYAIKQR